MAKCYEKYKDSGIAWIGEIPEHWSVKRLNDIGKYRKGPFGSALKVDSFIDKSDDAIKVYEQQNAIKKSAIIGASYISKEYFENNMKGFEVCANDIIVSCAGTIGELFVLPSNIEKGIINQALMRMRMDCRYVNLSFFLYIFDILLRVESEQSSNGSAMKNIPPFDILKKIRIPLANISEQEQIAKYLDWKCGEVDRIVEVRERQIKLLGELRTSVISRAVTHGLNPNAPLKNSGIDWIGQIPKHWETIKLKYIFTFGKGLNITKEDLVESGMPVISYGQIHSKENHGTGVKESLKRFVNGDYLKTNRQSLVNNNDFIFADTSEDLEGVGNCVFVDNNEMLFAGYHTITLKVKNMQHNKYLAYLFLSDLWRTQIRSRVTGVKVFSITKTILNFNTVLLPPIAEQQQIAEYLDRKTAEIDSTIDKFKVQIDKLKEYRQALITEVVTGKIDVRDIEIPTPKSN